MNYNNDDKSSPFKQGKLKDIVKPKQVTRHTRSSYKSDKEAVDALTVDLVQVLADVGIVIKNVHTIAKRLMKCGWVKTKKLEG